MENYGKDSQEVKAEGNKIHGDDISWQPGGPLVDTQPMVEVLGLRVKN